MHRIDTVGATPDNRFKETPAPATRVSDDWLTAVQEELANVIELLGLAALNKGNNAQVANAIFIYANRRLQKVNRVISHEDGGDEEVDEEDGEQLVRAIQRLADLRLATTKASVERVITDPTGGNSGLDGGSPQQLLNVLIAMMNARAGGAKAYTDYLILDEDGGDATGLDYGAPEQLLNAVQRMIGLGIGAAFTLTVEGSGTSTQRTISFAGGLFILKMGYYRATISTETTGAVTFTTPFPNECWSPLTQVVIASASSLRDLWTQTIPGLTDRFGFTVQFQDGGGGNALASGFDWWAIGN